jgi:hypothetical protein
MAPPQMMENLQITKTGGNKQLKDKVIMAAEYLSQRVMVHHLLNSPMG